MLDLIKVIIQTAGADQVKAINLSMSAYYQLLTDLPELPDPTENLVIDGVPIHMRTPNNPLKRKISIILKRTNKNNHEDRHSGDSK